MSFPEYAKYEDSGVEWLGKVPEHWEVTPIKNLVKLCSGGTPSKVNLDYWDGEVPWASAKDLKSELLSDTEDHITQHAIDDGVASLVAAESLLIVVRGMILVHTFPVVKALVPMAINQDLKAVLPTAKLNVNFLAWLLRGSAQETIRRIDEAGHGTKALRMEAWTSMRLPVPTRGEQILIAAFLDRETAKIDALVGEQWRLIELLREKRRTVISNAVTKGLSPHAPMKPSGIEWLGDVPEHWKICLLKRAFRSVDYGISDSLDSEGAVAILRMGNIANGKVVTDDLKYIDSVDPCLLLEPGDLLYNRTNSLDLIGKVGMFLGDAASPVSFASYLVRLRTVDESLPEYFAYLLNTDGILGLARSNAFVAIGQCNLNPTRYGQIIIAIPPRHEQTLAIEYINTETAKLDTLTVEAQLAIDLLQERRTALISAAVTGKIDVRGLAESEEAA